MVPDYINTLEIEFLRHANADTALAQKKYVKNKFEYFGLKTPDRREIQKPFLHKDYLPAKNELEDLLKELWNKPQREFQYFGIELLYKYRKQLDIKDIDLFEYLIIHKPWWETIDGIAPKLVGDYFKIFPEQRDIYIDKWLSSGNIWLQRSCLIFQLFYKEELDTKLLTHVIEQLLGSKEFFINKAIGWILRQYSRTNPQWVVEFANNTELHPLSKREAMRLIR